MHQCNRHQQATDNGCDPQPDPSAALQQLQSAVQHALAQHPGGLSEYALLQWLEQHLDGFTSGSDDPDLDLFQRHFLLMHTLYGLQPFYAAQGQHLSISALKIELLPLDEQSAAGLPAQSAERQLNAYYGDLSQLDQTGGNEVRALLQTFWQRLLAHQAAPQAYAALDLPPDASWQQIVRRYRALAAQHHPDKGGDPHTFAHIRQAYEQLKQARPHNHRA